MHMDAPVLAAFVSGFLVFTVLVLRSFVTGWERGGGRGGVVG